MDTQPGRQILIDGATARSAPYRGLFAEVVRWLSAAYLTLNGWKMRGRCMGASARVGCGSGSAC